jgi:O-antigen/teichoic acid export membrane protein
VETTSPATETAPVSLLARLRASTAARDGLWVLAAQGLAALIALGVDVLLFRNLDQAERGTLTAALGLRNIFLYIADLGMALTTVRVGAEFLGKGLRNEAHTVFRRALVTRLVLACLVAAVACALAPLLGRLLLAAGGRPELIWASAAALVGMTATAWGGDVAQACRRFTRYFAHQVIEAALRAVAVVLVFLAVCGVLLGAAARDAHLRTETILWPLALASILAGACSILVQRRQLKLAPRPSDEAAPSEPPQGAFHRFWRTLCGEDSVVHGELRSFSRYAVAIALLQTVMAYVEIFLIQCQRGPNETAVFEGGRRLALVLPLIGGALTTVLLPRVAVLSTPEACAAYVRKALWVSVPLAVLAAASLAAAAGLLVPLLWSGRYADSILPLRWLCAGYGFSIVLAPLILVLFPLRREGTVLLIQIAGLTLALGLGAYLIPRFGAVGAAWSSLCVRAVMTLACAAAVFVFLRRKEAS